MKPKKVYIAAPFRSLSTRDSDVEGRAYGVLKSEANIKFLEDIEAQFLADGWTTCLPHRDEGNWGETYYEPRAIGTLCLRHVETSELICAVLGASRGVPIELTWMAREKGVSMVWFRTKGQEASTLQTSIALPAKHRDRLPSKGEFLEIEVDDVSEVPSIVAKLLQSTEFSEQDSMRRMAVVDIGSNSLKFSAFRVGQRAIRLDEPDRESIGIADSVRATGSVSSEKLKEMDKFLRKFADKISTLNIDTTIVVGTESLRRADNLADVDSLVKGILGVAPRVLTQEDEAKAVGAAVKAAVFTDDSVAALNLGGSSTQIITNVNGVAPEYALFDVGTKDLIHSMPWDAPWEEVKWERLKDEVRQRLNLKYGIGSPCEYLFHTGGELDFLLRCQVELETNFISNSHVSRIAVSDFKQFAEEFYRQSPKWIMKKTRLQAGWLAGAVASNAVALCVAEALNAKWLVPSNLNVVDGLIELH